MSESEQQELHNEPMRVLIVEDHAGRAESSSTRFSGAYHIMKKFLCYFTLAVLSQHLHAQDLQTGTTFSDGQTVTAALLNNATNNAVIQPAFISGKSSAAPVSTDQIVFYQTSGGTLKKTTISSLLAVFTAAPTFTGTTTISQGTVISGMLTPATITADQNDYNPTGLSTATTLRLASDNLGTRNITGLAGGADGRIILIHNIGTTDNIVLNNANASSTAANRFAFVGDRTIKPNGVLILQYDGTTARWRTTQKAATDDVTLAPSFATLTDGTTITWALDSTKDVQNAKVTLAGSPRQLIMTGLVNGMSGTLEVIQDGTGTRSLDLPGTAFTDLVTHTSTTIDSAAFTGAASDNGKAVSSPGNIPAGTTIVSNSAGHAVISAAATTTASSQNLYLPARVSKVVAGGNGRLGQTTTASAIDVFTWAYDGTNIVWTSGKNFN